ncbi:tRNA-splicing endonuclease subunit sen54 [Malassezia vespertilionis]|uniref:tRNA-splicing endonuclease subunit sen54 n=1 Tax=Malassezia vespertilionis TaxID=2020962 RepID=UPI0024B10DBB|nr:tRNA-splicing endonuclease subunit sen54 [Malassezia vespertilionis]WFD07875.1 tRNA-splicing endonuclease subunit sen54 [Malassezia vespertilionis]
MAAQANAPHPESEEEEEEDMPDYRVLASIAQKYKTGSLAEAPIIPKRGEKDFEPTGFGGQSKVLAQSRDALFHALSARHAHSSKTLSTATWDPVFMRAFVHTQRGQSCSSMGSTVRRAVGDNVVGCLELYPEEAVYLVERGALDCRFTATPGVVPDEARFAACIPVSVEQAYAQMLGNDGASPARYQIYAYLKRLGYIVQRATLVDGLRASFAQNPATLPARARSLRAKFCALLVYVLGYLAVPLRYMLRILRIRMRMRAAPRGLLGISAHDTYDTIFDALQIVRADHDQRTHPAAHDPALAPFFYAWRPATQFKRTRPPPPEFRICVVETNEHPMLSLCDFDVLFSHIPLSVAAPGAPTTVAATEEEREMLSIREQNRKAYGKQKQASVRHGRTRPPGVHTTTFGKLVSRFAWLVRLLVAALRRWGIFRAAPPQRKTPFNVYLPLKAGRRNVVVAIVDQGTMSLLRFGEAEFKRWRLAGAPVR